MGFQADDKRSGGSSQTPAGDAVAARRGACPELASLSALDFRHVYEAVTVVALRRARSKALAEEIVQKTFERLLTTRRWNPDVGPLAKHLAGIVKSLVHHEHENKGPERGRRVHECFQREVLGEEAPSPEERMLQQTEDDARQAEAARELAALEERVAGNEVARGVLRCRAAGVDKSAEIARTLNVSVEHVYRATELLRYHLKRIREDGKT